jgi:hypothetical protein
VEVNMKKTLYKTIVFIVMFSLLLGAGATAYAAKKSRT